VTTAKGLTLAEVTFCLLLVPSTAILPKMREISEIAGSAHPNQSTKVSRPAGVLLLAPEGTIPIGTKRSGDVKQGSNHDLAGLSGFDP
jgi:hypothetical protein